MLAINHGNTAKLPTRAKATERNVYRLRREACDAAVLAIGPHARDGFEFTVTKCDGAWMWRPTDTGSEPMFTAQHLKAMGGKKAVLAMALELADRAHGKPASAEVRALVHDAKIVSMPPTAPSKPAVAQSAHADDDIPAFCRMTEDERAAGRTETKTATVKEPKCQAIRSKPSSSADGEKAIPLKKSIENSLKSSGSTTSNTATSQISVGDQPSGPRKLEPKSNHEHEQKAAAKTKTEIVADLLRRKEGCTTADILAATGWPAVSVPAIAKAAKLNLRRVKDGRVSRYFGH